MIKPILTKEQKELRGFMAKMRNTQEYKEMIKSINELVLNDGYKNILMYDIDAMIKKKNLMGWYVELRKDIVDFYKGIPLYMNNLLSDAHQLYLAIKKV